MGIIIIKHYITEVENRISFLKKTNCAKSLYIYDRRMYIDINMPQALTALASTSLIRPIPTASYAGTPKKATSIGPITAVALIPANPVPMPAPAPARKHMSIFNNSS